MPLTISYSDEDFFFTTRRDKKSLMDDQLQTIWENKVEQGLFKYEISDLQTKCLLGKYGFIVQLNQDRAIKRRKPQFVSDVSMEFDQNQFHFGKVPEKEERNKHVLMINVSPLEYCHSLIVPSIEKCLPQILKYDEFRLAVELMLKSQDSSFRIGFNSLGGFASVNHLHLHAYYLKYELFLEHAPTKHLEKFCYELIEYPSEGFVFEILQNKDIKRTAKAVVALTNCLVSNDIAHNVFLTRGTPLSKPSTDQNELSAIRIYVWAREARYGIKDGNSFNVAVCELAGHIPMKDEESFQSISEDVIASHLYEACHQTFITFRPRVKSLFQELNH